MRPCSIVLLFFFYQITVTQAQINDNSDFESLVKLSLSLSEKSIYLANFDEAEKYVQISHFEKFEMYQPKHQLALIIQTQRIKSFKNRIKNIKVDQKKELEFLLDLQPILETINDKNTIGDYYSLLASGYFSNKENDLAFHYFDKAMQSFNEIRNFYKIAQTRPSILSLKQTILQREKNDEALKSMVSEFEKEIEFAKKHENIYALSFNTRHLAQIYLRQIKDYEKAKKLFEYSLALREEIGFKPYLPASYFSLGEVAEKMKDDDEAIKIYKKSFELADEISFVRYQYIARIKIAEIFQQQVDINKAKSFYIDALKSASSNGYLTGIDEALQKIEALEDN